MKLKNLFNCSVNKANNQEVLTIKKRELKKAGLSKSDLLDMELDNYLKKCLD